MTTCIINSVEFQFVVSYQGIAPKWGRDNDKFVVTLSTNFDNIPVSKNFTYYMGLGCRKDNKPNFSLESFMRCILNDAWYGLEYSVEDFIIELGYSRKEAEKICKECEKICEKIGNLFGDRSNLMLEYLWELGY